MRLKLRMFAICFVGGLGVILFMNESYTCFWSFVCAVVCIALAVSLYRRWNEDGELDDNKYL